MTQILLQQKWDYKSTTFALAPLHACLVPNTRSYVMRRKFTNLILSHSLVSLCHIVTLQHLKKNALASRKKLLAISDTYHLLTIKHNPFTLARRAQRSIEKEWEAANPRESLIINSMISLHSRPPPRATARDGT